MFKEVDDKDIAELFGISLEQARKEMDDGTIKCIAEEIVDKFNEIPHTSFWLTSEEIKRLLRGE